MDRIPKTAAELLAAVRLTLGDPVDLRSESSAAERITTVYLASFVDKRDLQDNFLAPLGRLCPDGAACTWEGTILPAIPEEGRTRRESLPEVVADLLNGYAAVHLAGSEVMYTYDAHQSVKRPPTVPQIERSIRGPKVSLVEEIDKNLLMLRERIRNQALRVDGLRLGRRSQTKVYVLYLDDVADPGIVKEVHRRLGRIDIDGIVDSGYVEQLISDNHWALFPLTQSTERPDKLMAGILEGRVAILVDGSASGILVPTTVNELYQSPEDYFFPFWFGVFLRAFRVFGNLVAVTLPGLYVALLGVNPQLLPIKFALTVAGSRIGVSLPLVVEMLFIEAAIEIFREGSLRLPTTVSQTLGVASGIVLGLATVSAGIVSSTTLVVVIVTAIASYSGPNYEIGLSWRILRFGLIFAAAFLGMYGLTIAGFMILAHAAIQNSFGVSYLSPWAPIRLRALGDTIMRRPLWQRKRLGIYHPADAVRYREKGGKHEDKR